MQRLTLNGLKPFQIGTPTLPAKPERRRLTATERGERQAKVVRKRTAELGRILDVWLAGNAPNLDVLSYVGADAADAIEHLAHRAGPFDLHLMTFAAGASALQRLHRLRSSGRLTSILAVVDVLMTCNSKGAPAAQLRQTADRLAITQMHAKAYVLTPTGGKGTAYTITGSANLTSNPRVEILQVSREPSLADFYRQAILELVDAKERRE